MQMETLNHAHVLEEKGWLFHSETSEATEEEYLYLLFALIYCLKPNSVLETGSNSGLGTSYLARALQRNGLGHCISVELHSDTANIARRALSVADLEEWATVITADSMEFLRTTDRKFDFAFFDSMIPLRCKELKLCLERKLLRPGAMAALHDTSRLRTLSDGSPDPQAKAYWEEFQEIKGIRHLEFPLSRGLTLVQVI